MRLAIRHTTRYGYEGPIVHGLQRLRLTPKETQGQTIVDGAMEYEGAHEELSYDDQNFNHVTLVAAEEGVSYSPVSMDSRLAAEAATTPIETGSLQVRATITLQMEIRP